MSAFTSFIEILPHAQGLNKGPYNRSMLLSKDYREWQVHTEHDVCDVVYQNDKVPEYLLGLKQDEHIVREFYYGNNNDPNEPEVGLLIFKDGKFLGVEIIKYFNQEKEQEISENLLKEKYNLNNPKYHYGYVYN